MSSGVFSVPSSVLEIVLPQHCGERCSGITVFPGGDATTLYQSIQKIFTLPPETRLFMCHDYKAPNRDEFGWESTVAEQKASNVHVHEGIEDNGTRYLKTPLNIL